ncbi:glutamate-rich protein 5 isoform X1 [Emydura macquarii macquarii]|uniref:glutamate-rich protein 5 isoform X1 n=1 Tax=Emydura macquarii macquarii TaxID=1129001 RepID=UPI00352A8F8C
MGCSSSAQTQDSKRPAAKPSDTNGLQKCATSDENSPTTDENETIPDQTKLDPMEDVDLSPEETKPSENLPAEETEVLIPGPAECVNSNYKKVDLEGTEPLAAGPPEATGSLVEGTGILPPAGAAEGTGIPPPAGVAEGSVSPVTEIIRKVQINEEDQLIEGNICAFADSRGQILPSETCVPVPLTSVNAALECVRAEFSPQSFYNVVHEKMWLGKPHVQKSKL